MKLLDDQRNAPNDSKRETTISSDGFVHYSNGVSSRAEKGAS